MCLKALPWPIIVDYLLSATQKSLPSRFSATMNTRTPVIVVIKWYQLSEIDAALIAQKGNMLPSVYEELSFSVRQAKTNILAWKAHKLRSVNQDSSRIDVLELLDESSVLVVQDWAMKYLPRKYRESQTDWFGKRGIPWHISVAFGKISDQFPMLTFAHIFQTCSQDSCAVLAVMVYVIKQLDHHTRPEESQLPPRQCWLLSLQDHHCLCKHVRSRAGCNHQMA